MPCARRNSPGRAVNYMTSSEFSPLQAFTFALHRWWLVAIFVFAGGLLGWGFSRLHAPLYDAQALLVINIDYQQAPELTDRYDDHYTEDHVIGAAHAVVISTYVLDQVKADLQARRISLNWEKYIPNLSVERLRSEFWLKVRDTDPNRAALIANIWIQKAYDALVQFHQHAVTAKILRDYASAMSACPPPPDIEPRPPSLCGNGSPAEIQKAVEAVTAQIQAETAASVALNPALTFNLAQEAAVPVTPVAYRASLLVVAGALLGCAVGIAVMNLIISRGYSRRSLKQEN